MLRRIGRALLLRCPNCGRSGITRRYFGLVESCPRCGHLYERQEGYWLGAIAINTGAVIVAFTATFVGGMVLTWPDVPWTALTIVTVVVNIAFPVLFHPFSRTLWLAIDLTLHPPERRELLAAAERLDQD